MKLRKQIHKVCQILRGFALVLLLFLITVNSQSQTTIQNVSYLDTNFSFNIDQGDKLVLTFDQDIAFVQSSVTPEVFFIPVIADSLGLSATMERSTFNPKQVIIHLGFSPQLEILGNFLPSQISPGSPSGLDISADLISILTLDFLKKPFVSTAMIETLRVSNYSQENKLLIQ